MTCKLPNLKSLVRQAALWVACAMVLLLGTGCTPLVRERTLPPSIRSVYIPMIDNRTQEYGLEERFTEAFQREVLADGRLRVVREKEADAIIRITLVNFAAVPQSFDSDRFPTSQTYQVEARMQIQENLPGRPTIGGTRQFRTNHFFNADPRTTTYDPEPRRKEELATAFARDAMLELMTGDFEDPEAPRSGSDTPQRRNDPTITVGR